MNIKKRHFDVPLVEEAKQIRLKLAGLSNDELQREYLAAEELLLSPVQFDSPELAVASIKYMAAKIQIQKRKGVQHV